MTSEVELRAGRAWLSPRGEFWTMAFGDSTVNLRDGKGVRYLAALVASTGVEMHALDLVASDGGGAAPASGQAAGEGLDLQLQSDDAGPMLDAQAKKAYRLRITELREEIDEADEFNDPERAAAAREELSFIEHEMSAAVGLGGRDRRSASAAERARVNVTRALKTTIKRVADHDATLGRYLELSVKTGIFCSFHPPPDFELLLGEPPSATEAVADEPPPPIPVVPGGPASKVAPRARALKTLLFVEIGGALELAARLGDDAWRSLLDRHDAILTEEGAKHGGEVAGRSGDRTLVVFDAPGPALDCAETIVVHSREAGLDACAGLHTGECELLGGGPVGIAVHVAARVASLAQSGEVLLSNTVRDLVAGSDLQVADRGIHALRGVAGEWRIFALSTAALEALPADGPGVDPPHSDTPAVPLAPALVAAAERPLFGRTAELERLTAALERAAGGERRLVLLGGEPGIGKTRLVAELAARAHERGALVLYGRCDEDLGIPYQPFVEALGHYVEHSSAQLVARQRDAQSGALSRLLPQLAAGGPGQAPDPATGDRHVLFSEVGSMLATNQHPPLVLVLDDLHWADKATLLLLKYLFHSPTPSSVLLVGTYRTTGLPADGPLQELVADLGRAEDCERMELAGLDQADIVGLTAALAGHQLAPAIVELSRSLSGGTGGNPFFLTEILRGLADSGDLERAGDAAAGSASFQVELPGTIRETVGHRVGKLPEATQEILGTAAAIGSDFEPGLLARAAETSEDEVLDALDDAVAAGIVTEPPGDGNRYSFSHGLIGHTLYERLGPGRRRRTHRRIAQALEDLCGDNIETRIAELAHHVIKGAYSEDLPRALDYARRAGDRALAQLAPQEAESWYQRALQLADEQPDAESLRCELLIGLGTAQNQSGNAAFRATLLEAAELARRVGDSDGLVRAALANTRGFVSATGVVDAERIETLEAALAAVGDSDSADRAKLLALLAAELTFAGDWDRRLALSDEALATARRLSDADTLGHVLSTRFMTIWTPEALPERDANTEEEIALAHASGDPLDRFRATHWRAVVSVEAGRLQEAAMLVERECRLADQLGQPTAQWLAAYDRATQALMHGLLDEAETWARDAGRIATESGQPEAQAFLVGQLVNIRFEQGRLGELEPTIAAQVDANPGIPAFRAALTLARAEGEDEVGAREVLDVDTANGFASFDHDSNWLVGLAIYAEACGRLGEEAAARALHGKLEPFADQVAFNSATAWGLVERHLGTLAGVLGETDEAETRLRAAAARHEEMGAPVWLARTRLDLGRLLREHGRGDRDEARWLAEQAMATARNLGCLTIERRAAAFLEESS
jgi:class 3 adenylate cyclase/tetratricopeptide (TPR) repeat protein